MKCHALAATLLCLAPVAAVHTASGERGDRGAPQMWSAAKQSVERTSTTTDHDPRCASDETEINGWGIAVLTGALAVLQLRRKHSSLQRSVLDP
jgi:hypothetical protein